MRIDENLHPYINELHESYEFDYEPLDISAFDGRKENIKIRISKGAKDLKSDNNLKFFHIETIYERHRDVVARLISTRKTYTDSVLEEIKDLLNSHGKVTSTDDLFNDLFNKPKPHEVLNTSLGKLNKDIISKLKKIK